MVKIFPSLLAADFGALAEQVRRVESAGADGHHIDVMDGHFVPNISFGPVVIEQVAKVATKPLDIHLMLEYPSQYLQEYIKFQPQYLSIHAEIAGNVKELLQQIRQSGIQSGLAIKPMTAVNSIVSLLPYVDMITVMTVEPGFGGQSFMSSMVAKISDLRSHAAQYDFVIAVDGGITASTAKVCVDQGADLLIAGSSVYNTRDSFAANIQAIRQGIN